MVKDGYKQTEIGIIPWDWEVINVGDMAMFANGKPHEGSVSDNGEFYLITLDSIDITGNLKSEHKKTNVNDGSLQIDDIVIILSDLAHGNLLGLCDLIPANNQYILNQRVGRLRTLDGYSPNFLRLQINLHQTFFKIRGQGTSQKHIYKRDVSALQIPLPSLIEQRAIAAVLSDVDALIAALDKLIAKKRAIKTGTMQVLLSGEKRLPGFGDDRNGRWETATVEDVADCLDNLRIPLNESQRNRMKGDIPYCGANGIVDFVNDYVVDDDIILMAEDGGYFDEYATRPIAYRMIGKCWVNNHAHILKARDNTSQGFLFYSLVHKDIQKFLASGTRAKLNKSEMYKIEINLPQQKEEQEAIAQILSDMDSEIAVLEARRAKTQAIKEGMMQELLTGRTRIV